MVPRMKTYALHVSRFAVAAITTGWTATAFTADLHRDAAAAPPSQWATGHSNQLARVAVQARSRVPLTITSPAFKDGGDIPRENTQYGANIFPGLGWSKGPEGTKSYVVIVQGDAISGSTTSIHLTLFNVPASVTKLGAGMTTVPSGAAYGPNVHGLNQPYVGPHPHTGARQRYHLQVFALDTTLGSDPPLSLEGLESAMIQHVLASGELVGVAAGEPGTSR
jgi:para-nitrobenzyl esterase